MLRTSAPAATALVLLAACTPTSTPPSNATATGGPTPNCGFARAQTSNDLRMNCTLSGALANASIDPVHPGSSACSPTSFNLFSQTINANIAVIYGENGDENDESVDHAAHDVAASRRHGP